MIMRKPEKNVIFVISLVIILVVAGLLTSSRFWEDDDYGALSENVVIGPGGFYYLKTTGGDVDAMPSGESPLSEGANKAIRKLPGWLQGDIESKFMELSAIPIQHGGYSVPSFCDIEGDGDQDMVVGVSSGELFFKLNIGTGYSSRMKGTDLLQEVNTGSHSLFLSSPALVDLDNDGDTDLVIGSGDGTLTLFRNVGSNTYPGWEEDTNEFQGIDIGMNARPYFADMNDDGKLDLTLGGIDDVTEDADIRFYWNHGTDGSPNWVRDDTMYLGLLVFGVEQYPNPALADLDNDGNLELALGGTNGQLRLFTMEVGGVPIWRELGTVFADIDVGAHATPAFTDLNGDNCSDLVVGTGNGEIYYFENRGTPEYPRYIALCSGEIYHSGTMGELAGDTLHEARKVFLGPGTINVDRTFKEDVEEDVEIYADLILECPDYCVDELGFIIAHTAVPVLRVMSGTTDINDPECSYDAGILLDHVKEHYELKGKLNYADLVEKKDYTTIRYTNGDGEKRELPRDVYYWHVVHPRCRYEAPGYTHGDFWRDYLRYDDQYGMSLLDVVKDAENTHEAVYKLTEWVVGYMDFGYESTDKTPIEIYDLHYGSCGEHSILTNALGRAVFIPTRLANNWGEDHVWNEFYDAVQNGSWHHWDITGPGIDDPERYERDWGKDISTVWSHRGDDFVYGITEKYTPTSQVTVNVVDRNGDPVDGACVVMESEYFVRTNPTYWPVPTISLWNYTDTHGQTVFDLGGNYYTIDVMSPMGNFHRGYPNMNHLDPTGMGSYYVVEGTADSITCRIDGNMPWNSRGTNIGSLDGDSSFQVCFEVEKGEVNAQSIITYPDDTNIISGNEYPVEVPGEIDFFVCDQINFDLFRQGYPYEGYQLLKNAVSGCVEIPKGDWYIVFSNDVFIGTSQFVEVKCEKV